MQKKSACIPHQRGRSPVSRTPFRFRIQHFPHLSILFWPIYLVTGMEGFAFWVEPRGREVPLAGLCHFAINLAAWTIRSSMIVLRGRSQRRKKMRCGIYNTLQWVTHGSGPLDSGERPCHLRGVLYTTWESTVGVP